MVACAFALHKDSEERNTTISKNLLSLKEFGSFDLTLDFFVPSDHSSPYPYLELIAHYPPRLLLRRDIYAQELYCSLVVPWLLLLKAHEAGDSKYSTKSAIRIFPQGFVCISIP